METEKIIQIESHGADLMALTNRGSIWKLSVTGWKEVNLPESVDATAREKKNDEKRKSGGK